MATAYEVRLGPLAFVCPIDAVGESVGDGLDVVGAALTASERKPRPLKLKLPVHGYDRSADPKSEGLLLRRHVRQAMDNVKLRLGGFFFYWEADPELDCWLLVGSAEVTETDPGITFGEFQMELSDVYVVGRPGTHRPGRRADIVDLRQGAVSWDTRGRGYFPGYATQALPAEPIYLPGDCADLVRSGNRPATSTGIGPERAGRHLWRTVAAEDGEILSYVPDPILLASRTGYLDLDDVGSVRVWDLSEANVYPPAVGEYTTAKDTEPDVYYGWERVLGNTLTATHPLAVENGQCRLIWLGSGSNEGLAVESWDPALGHYKRKGRVLHSLNVREQRVVELTAERAVLEWRAGQYCLRAILQRGWGGPKLESYDDSGGQATVEFARQDGRAVEWSGVFSETAGAVGVADLSPTTAPDNDLVLWANVGEEELEPEVAGIILSGQVIRYGNPRTLLSTLAFPPTAATAGTTAERNAVGQRTVVDARPVPVLIGR